MRSDVYPRLLQILKSWAKLRAKKIFSGMSLDQFGKATQGCKQYRDEIQDLETRLALARKNCAEADAAARKLIQRVVLAVQADPDEGLDSELYAEMGYLPRSARISLRVQGRKAARAAQAKNGGDETGA